MQLRVARRAEVAVRSLPQSDKNQVLRALDQLSVVDRETLGMNRNLHKLAATQQDRALYVMRANSRLRIVLSFDGDVCFVEDIVDHDRLAHLVSRERQA